MGWRDGREPSSGKAASRFESELGKGETDIGASLLMSFFQYRDIIAELVWTRKVLVLASLPVIAFKWPSRVFTD